jgi:Lon protease-like protein
MPLQVFEERYKLLLRHCLDRDSKFGVVLIKSGSEVGEPAIPHTTGTVAHIVQVNKASGDRFFVSVTGLQRFHIRNITQYRPFLGAEVELLEEESDQPVSQDKLDAVREAATRYVRLTMGISGGWARQVRLPSDAARLANNVAGMLQVSVQDKQALLEEPSTTTRLETELEILNREVAALKRRVSRELRGKYGRQ